MIILQRPWNYPLFCMRDVGGLLLCIPSVSQCFKVSKNLTLITSVKPQNPTCDVGTIFSFTDKEAQELEK